MPTIDISDANFARLQKYATPLVDSGDSTLAKVLDLLEGKTSPAQAQAHEDSTFDPLAPPDLTHTKVTRAMLNGRSLLPAQRNWNAIMLAAIHDAATRLPEGREIADLIVVNHVQGKKEDSGYKFQEGLNVSVQGQDSNSAWKAIAHLARETGLTADVTFAWYPHPNAFRPGETGRLSV